MKTRTFINIGNPAALFKLLMTLSANQDNVTINPHLVISEGEFISNFGSYEFPDPEMLPTQYDPMKDGN